MTGSVASRQGFSELGTIDNGTELSIGLGHLLLQTSGLPRQAGCEELSLGSQRGAGTDVRWGGSFSYRLEGAEVLCKQKRKVPSRD